MKPSAAAYLGIELERLFAFESEAGGCTRGFMGTKTRPDPSSFAERGVLVAGTHGLVPEAQAAYLAQTMGSLS